MSNFTLDERRLLYDYVKVCFFFFPPYNLLILGITAIELWKNIVSIQNTMVRLQDKYFNSNTLNFGEFAVRSRFYCRLKKRKKKKKAANI